MRAVNAQLVHQAQLQARAEDIHGHALPADALLRLAKAGHIHQDDPEVLRELIEAPAGVVPGVGAGPAAMRADERRAAAGLVVVDVDPVHLYEAVGLLLGERHRRSLHPLDCGGTFPTTGSTGQRPVTRRGSLRQRLPGSWWAPRSSLAQRQSGALPSINL